MPRTREGYGRRRRLMSMRVPRFLTVAGLMVLLCAAGCSDSGSASFETAVDDIAGSGQAGTGRSAPPTRSSCDSEAPTQSIAKTCHTAGTSVRLYGCEGEDGRNHRSDRARDA